MAGFLRWLGKRVATHLNTLRPDAEKAIHYIREQLPIAEIWRETRAKQYEQLVLDQAFWDAAQTQFAGEASPLAHEIMLRGALEATQLLPAVNFELANQTVYQLAGQYTNEWWHTLQGSTRNQLRDAIQSHIASGAPHSSLIKTLDPLFGRQRADVIATTEVTRMYAEGNSIGYQTAGINTISWMTASDELVCPICEPLDGQQFPIGGNKPPAHVNCRCWIAPVTAEGEILTEPADPLDTLGENVLRDAYSHAGRSSNEDWYRSLSDRETRAINSYLDELGFQDINEWLRSGRSPTSISRLKMRADISHLDAAIARSYGAPSEVYRGVLDQDGTFRNLKVGDLFNESAYTSTSATKDAAAMFAGEAGDTSQGVLLKIRIPKDAPAAYIEMVRQAGGSVLSDYTAEDFIFMPNEYLLPRGSTFRISEIGRDEQWQMPEITLELEDWHAPLS